MISSLHKQALRGVAEYFNMLLRDKAPTPPYPVHAHLDRPAAIPALIEVYESARRRLRSKERIQMTAPPSAAETGPS